ncbi:MFS transporter [bacterium]|nr:MFS transporter [bacterium]
MLGWGLGTDTYFSIYVQTIVESPWGVMMIGAILALAKLLFVVPVGELNDRVHSKHLLLLGKILYVVCAFFFFFAGFWHSWECLLVAVIFNGFANAITFTTYRSYYAKHSTQFTRTQVF